MKFYNRENEIKRILEIQEISKKNAQFTVVTGRRRIGKTQLLLNALKDTPTLYFFVTRKAEPFLCQDFQQEVSLKLGVPILGEISSFEKLFLFLIQLSAQRHFTLIIDEFQEFMHVNPSVYSSMQKHWDLNKDTSNINLIVCGSVYSLMHKIFKDYKAPLFGRATSFMQIKAFKVSVLKELLHDLSPNYEAEDLLALYMFTGGVAKYVQLLADNNALQLGKMLDYIIREDSPFITDGKNMLIDEFGRDYTVYFTILSAIARGDNARGIIETYVGKEIGGYLTRLEHDYGLITKSTPIYAKSQTKNVRYVLNDNYLTFWFRFVYKYSNLIEIAQYDQLKQIVERDYKTFSGKILEYYFRDTFIESGNITHIGAFWDSKGTNEIDLIVVNELAKTIKFVEVKRNEKHIRYNSLKEKAAYFVQKTPQINDYTIDYQGLSMKNM